METENKVEKNKVEENKVEKNKVEENKVEEVKTKKKTSKEKQKQYNTTFYAQHKDKKYMCEVCRKEVNYFNKSVHLKTAVHQRLSK
jgi:hypothetical protein